MTRNTIECCILSSQGCVKYFWGFFDTISMSCLIPHPQNNCKKSKWITKKWKKVYAHDNRDMKAKKSLFCVTTATQFISKIYHRQQLRFFYFLLFTSYFSFGFFVVAIVVKEGYKTSNFNRNGYFSTWKCQFVVPNGFSILFWAFCFFCSNEFHLLLLCWMTIVDYWADSGEKMIFAI